MTMQVNINAFNNKKDYDNFVSVWQAIKMRDSRKILKLYLDDQINKCHINFIVNGSTLLHEAVLTNYPLSVGLLLYMGSNPNIKNTSGFTALELALEWQFNRLVNLLVGKTTVTEQMLRHAILYDNSDEVVAALFNSLPESFILNQQGLFRQEVHQPALGNSQTALELNFFS